jgi:hypothetical protein
VQDIGDGSVSNDNKEVAAARLNGSAWSVPAKINSTSGVTQVIYTQVAVAIDANGDVMVLWVQGSNYAVRLIIDTWCASSSITNGLTDIQYAPDVVFVAPGQAVGVWQL